MTGRRKPRGPLADFTLDVYTIAWLSRRLWRPVVAHARRTRRRHRG
jgi:hypothetical protein